MKSSDSLEFGDFLSDISVLTKKKRMPFGHSLLSRIE